MAREEEEEEYPGILEMAVRLTDGKLISVEA
jgi:hypothetical protein